MLHAYIALTRPAAWFAAIDFADVSNASARIVAEFDGWAPALSALITKGETPPVLRPLHTLPVGHSWLRTRGVTLLGDAAHLAPPSGEGANLALRDRAELAAAIVAHPGDIEAALASYESAMFPRSAAVAEDALWMLAIFLDDRAPFGVVEFFKDARSRAHNRSAPRRSRSSRPPPPHRRRFHRPARAPSQPWRPAAATWRRRFARRRETEPKGRDLQKR